MRRGLLPTLTRHAATRGSGESTTREGGPSLNTVIGGGPLSPRWLEWFMGFPDGWTEPPP